MVDNLLAECDPDGVTIIDFYVRLLRRANVKTLIVTATGYAILVAGAFAFLELNKKGSVLAPATDATKSEIVKLDEIEASLNDLLVFVDKKRKEMNDTSEILETLKVEHSKLKPLVEADRSVVEALFAAQERRNDSKRWIGYAVSFGLGVASSIVATIVVSAIRNAIRARNLH